MTALSEYAEQFQSRLDVLSERTARRVTGLWRGAQAGDLDVGWDAVAPTLGDVMSSAQVAAAQAGAIYAARSLTMQGSSGGEKVVAEAFAGVTREGRAVVPELYASVTTTKTLIGAGGGVPAAFRAGVGVLSVLAANIIRDSGRGAAATAAVSAGSRHYVRVVQPGACSRCAQLAGVVGFRRPFARHPRCRCTSMWLTDNEAPEGFFSSSADYFDSLSEAEQDRVFTKSGAWAIREGADISKVVNARRGALQAAQRPDGSYLRARLRPQVIGVKADGSPLTVYATPEGTTARSRWARGQGLDQRLTDERYRRTSSLRLMPEQIQTMSQSPEHARELLRKYGYLY